MRVMSNLSYILGFFVHTRRYSPLTLSLSHSAPNLLSLLVVSHLPRRFSRATFISRRRFSSPSSFLTSNLSSLLFFLISLVVSQSAVLISHSAVLISPDLHVVSHSHPPPLLALCWSPVTVRLPPLLFVLRRFLPTCHGGVVKKLIRRLTVLRASSEFVNGGAVGGGGGVIVLFVKLSSSSSISSVSSEFFIFVLGFIF